ncbi:histone H3-like 1, partial [Bienertia sinuspersici]
RKATRRSTPTIGGVKKPHRFRPETRLPRPLLWVYLRIPIPCNHANKLLLCLRKSSLLKGFVVRVLNLGKRENVEGHIRVH